MDGKSNPSDIVGQLLRSLGNNDVPEIPRHSARGTFSEVGDDGGRGREGGFGSAGNIFTKGRMLVSTETLGEEGGCLKESRSSCRRCRRPTIRRHQVHWTFQQRSRVLGKLMLVNKAKTIPLGLLKTAPIVSESTTCL